MKLVFATGNLNKLDEAQRILTDRFEIVTPASLGCHDDIPETSGTIRGNAVQKAQYIWDRFHIGCFADDTGLEIDALNGAPGVYSARYAGPEKNFAANVDLVLEQMKNVPAERRTARFRCAIALIIDGELNVFEGICEGVITCERRGTGGFGYDSIFLPDGFGQTMAEMTMEQKNSISHRGKALEMLKQYLHK